MASTFRPGTEALPALAAAPARPGINALTLKRSIIVSPQQMADVVRLRNALYPAEKDGNPPNELTLFGNKFVVGKSFGFAYAMDPIDLAGILRGIRQGKQHSDLLITSIHSHAKWLGMTSQRRTTVSPSETPSDYSGHLAGAVHCF